MFAFTKTGSKTRLYTAFTFYDDAFRYILSKLKEQNILPPLNCLHQHRLKKSQNDEENSTLILWKKSTLISVAQHLIKMRIKRAPKGRITLFSCKHQQPISLPVMPACTVHYVTMLRKPLLNGDIRVCVCQKNSQRPCSLPLLCS